MANKKAPGTLAGDTEGTYVQGQPQHLHSQNYTKALKLSTVFVGLLSDVQFEALADLIDALDALTPDPDFEEQCEDEGAQCEGEGEDSDAEIQLLDEGHNHNFCGEYNTMASVERAAAIWRQHNIAGPASALASSGNILFFGIPVPTMEVDWEYRP